MNLKQTPSPGTRVILHQGDALEFVLELHEARNGSGWLRSNIGNARIRFREIVRHVEDNQPIKAHDWRDLSMRKVDERRYAIRMPLIETGRFEAKTFFLPDDNKDAPIWPSGDNVIVKVEPADYCCANTIYTAFVRQFGPNKHGWMSRHDEWIAGLEMDGFSVIPRSGTFRDLIRELDFIIGRLGCRILQLLPIHPIPTTYARMGRYGSPFAVLDFMDIDPALAEFDRKTTPMEQFGELIDAVHARSGKLFIDIPINHTGWASKLQIEHPEWFSRGADRTFESPGAWGVTWEDLAKLNYSCRDLWKYMAEVFLFWCKRGVDGFRCDAGYMIPYSVWEYIVAKVRLEYPETIFLLEGLGGKIETVTALLDGANLDWAYSELFQNYNRDQIGSYLPGAIEISDKAGLLVHYAETHDNNRLAAVSETYAGMRAALCALFSQNGAFGITNGVEWLATDKVDVHNSPPLKWGNDINLVEHIAGLNATLARHPCFHPGAKLRFVHQGQANVVALARESLDGNDSVTVVVNLDHDRANEATWRPTRTLPATQGVVRQSTAAQAREDSRTTPQTCAQKCVASQRNDLSCELSEGIEMVDLLTGKHIPVRMSDGHAACALEPGQALCLTFEQTALRSLSGADVNNGRLFDRTRRQRLRAKALEVRGYYRPDAEIEGDVDQLARTLAESPPAFCAEAAGCNVLPVAVWRWPNDLSRVVMIPPRWFLYICLEFPFVATLRNGDRVVLRERSIEHDDGRHFVLARPPDPAGGAMRRMLELDVYRHRETTGHSAELLYLSSEEPAVARRSFTREEVERLDCYAICANGRGAMAQVRGAWGEIQSQYDALLAANLSTEHPVDRRIMFTRCRAWLVCGAYSQAIDRNCLRTFSEGKGETICWDFDVPAGQGRTAFIIVKFEMQQGRNAAAIGFKRALAGPDSGNLDDNTPVRLIIRPDIEDRINHEKTKAYMGPEKLWPRSVAAHKTGFSFSPAADRRLEMSLSRGEFTVENEWMYNVSHPIERERGIDDISDLFSPGYFTVLLKGGERCVLSSRVVTPETASCAENIGMNIVSQSGGDISLNEALIRAIKQFVVKRDEETTVIAGYPWFLDWGRDTLICLRGMISAGMLDEARGILRQFARYEEQGTLPNMIRGNDTSNRETSDAPLWFFVACSDLVRAERETDFLAEVCCGRSIRDVLVSIAKNYIKGTSNGIRTDAMSGLVFSPAHFTWMDTNHPAGTPREGYPIEIQALWHFALRFLAEIEPGGKWESLASQVKTSILKYFPTRPAVASCHLPPTTQHLTPNTQPFLSDCLHAKAGQPAGDAVPDDHLRPNQILAITLNAIDEPALCAGILAACQELLVPGAIRSLADRPVEFRLPISRAGEILNDPARPYWGKYEGEEDRRRKPAYHNGTAWTWLFPSYCEAMLKVYGEEARDAARAILLSSADVLNRGCVCQVPEILDGNAPHALRGCGAQAWGVTELFRALDFLQ